MKKVAIPSEPVEERYYIYREMEGMSSFQCIIFIKVEGVLMGRSHFDKWVEYYDRTKRKYQGLNSDTAAD